MTKEPFDNTTVFCHNFTVGTTIAAPVQYDSSDESEPIVTSHEIDEELRDLEKAKTLEEMKLVIRPVIRSKKKAEKKHTRLLIKNANLKNSLVSIWMNFDRNFTFNYLN